MAESAVAFLLQKLGNLIVREASLFGQVEVQVRLLCNELEWMRLFLEEVGTTRSYHNRLRLWMNQIRDAAYDAEDVIDEFMYKVEHQRLRRLDKLKLLELLPTWVSFADKLPFVHELDARIREISVKIEKILANKWRYGVENPVASEVCNASNKMESWKARRIPIVEEEDAMGIKDEMRAVKKMLIEGEWQREVVG
ncbi:hypothetical protein PVL29_020269 [Vitis rotundifolia]|uniref:Disease resistance N-terminal domain-containing protein n=1 Tax=Vitis rotundifolia TaxID=103349 RepID=A0AA39DEW2_VITRO|nr:hypothetical protein PVL29_020269 [Vitis rotundifolia]